MRRSLILPVVVVVLVAVVAFVLVPRESVPPAPVVENSAVPEAAIPGTQLLPGMGAHHHPVTTKVTEAQHWFDQALMLTFGFNHDAAGRSFMKATELDPECAMCWWGAALVLGPHVNAGMDPADAPVAWQRLQQALASAASATPRERDYIQALI